MWTCEQLAGFAKALAGLLIEQGLKPGSLVGIAVERSPEMVAAVLAVMMAAASMCRSTQDTHQPGWESMLADAGAEWLLVSSELNLNVTANVVQVHDALSAAAKPGNVALPSPPPMLSRT